VYFFPLHHVSYIVIFYLTVFRSIVKHRVLRELCYRTICTLIEEKVKGEQIGVTGDYPITATSIGCLFLFRVIGPRETSPMIWGFEKAKSKWLDKDPR
jgi:hypothetical protein